MADSIRFNSAAFEHILKQDSQAVLGRVVDGIAERAGDGFEASVTVGRTRARGSVITATPKAMQNNADHNVLIRVMYG